MTASNARNDAGDFPIHPTLHQRIATSSGSNSLEADRIAKANGMVGHRSRKTETAMKIELLMRRKLVCGAEVNCVLRAAALGKSAGVFHVSVPWRCELPIQNTRWIGRSNCAAPPLLATSRRTAPQPSSSCLAIATRQLQGRIIAMAGDQVRARGKSDRRY